MSAGIGKVVAVVALVGSIALGLAAPASGADPDRAVLQGQVTRLYLAYFRRQPDLAGLTYWINQLRVGRSLNLVSGSFAGSQEFRSTYGSLGDTSFVNLVYLNVLGRAPDAAGRTYWVGQLRSRRLTRGGVMLGFSESKEFIAKTGTTDSRPPFFRDGIADRPARTWRNLANGYSCYWARLRGFSGELGDVIANDIESEGRSIVTIAASDVGFESSRCLKWVPDVGPITLSPTSPFGGGTFRVRRDVAPGTWRASGTSGDCYWERLSGFSGRLEQLIANSFGQVRATVTISSTDVGFSSSRCGTWTKIG